MALTLYHVDWCPDCEVVREKLAELGHDIVARERLVAGFHVGQVQVGEHVGGEREEAIADRVPEIEDAPRPASQEPRAVHDVGVPVGDPGGTIEVHVCSVRCCSSSNWKCSGTLAGAWNATEPSSSTGTTPHCTRGHRAAFQPALSEVGPHRVLVDQ